MLMCPHEKNVTVVCFALCDGPDRRCLADCLQRRNPAMTYSCADVAEKMMDSGDIVQIQEWRKRKEGMQTDRRMDGQTGCFCAFR